MVVTMNDDLDGLETARGLASASRRVRWLSLAFVVLAILLVPWTVYLAYTLPHRATALHYNAAWTGFDIALTLVLLWTAWSAYRRSRWLTIAATVNATMLCVDAWFDVTTSPTSMDLWFAVLSAVVIELPLAAVCLWLAVNGQQIFAGRIVLHVRRRDEPASAELPQRQPRS